MCVHLYFYLPTLACTILDHFLSARIVETTNEYGFMPGECDYMSLRGLMTLRAFLCSNWLGNTAEYEIASENPKAALTAEKLDVKCN